MPYLKECQESMHPDLLKNMLVVDNTEDNKGAATSYNIGAKRVLEEKLDWLITLSPSTRFGPKGGTDFVNFLERFKSYWVVESALPVGWHFIAWNRKMFERIGLWDENFWPVYGEDADISYRILTAIEEDGLKEKWAVFPTDAWVTMQGYSAHKGGVKFDQTAIWDYYIKKWGGRSGHEIYKKPFNNYPIDWWQK